jgi:hypothetical protein
MTPESIFTNSGSNATATPAPGYEPIHLQGPISEEILENDPLAFGMQVASRKDILVYQVLNNAPVPDAALEVHSKGEFAALDSTVWSQLSLLEAEPPADSAATRRLWCKEGG